ncbi:uncharacterized protein [Prorops nasuta]|uniref:uncharacterized protein n=1 Tax=Prorops nasuta TaxID=863751 RepID=UPI0034CF5CC2
MTEYKPKKHTVPFLWVLCNSKTQMLYEKLFAFIKMKIVPQLETKFIHIDYEKVLQNAEYQQFPEAAIVGCYFHYVYNVRKNAKTFKLFKDFKALPQIVQIKVNFFMRLLYSLPLLPSFLMVEALIIIKKKIEQAGLSEKFKKLIAYIERFWLKIVDCQTLSVFNKKIRTNNVIERYHRMMKEKMGSHPDIFIFIDQISQVPTLRGDNFKVLKEVRDSVTVALNALKTMGYGVDHWDPIIVHSLKNKLDDTLRLAWEMYLGSSKDYPTFLQFSEFLTRHINSLQSLGNNPKTSKKESGKSLKSHAASVNSTGCAHCGSNHLLYQCKDYLALTPHARSKFAFSQNLCINCLRPGHSCSNCSSSSRCRKCSKMHHTLLHFDKSGTGGSKSRGTTPATNSASEPEPSSSHLTTHLSVTDTRSVLLATFSARIDAHDGSRVIVRGLVDPGSETSFISEKLAQQLRVPRQRINATIHGVNSAQTVRAEAQITLHSLKRHGASLDVTAIILSKITPYLPPSYSPSSIPALNGIELADTFASTKVPIDVLLGADYLAEVVEGPYIRCPDHSVLAQQTIFGWIVAGVLSKAGRSHSYTVHHCFDFEKTLRDFWELEEVPEVKPMSTEDSLCEQHFVDTVSRTPSGRFVVALPFRSDLERHNLGSSSRVAEKTLSRILRRLDTSPEQAESYSQFLQEYLMLGHMSPVPRSSDFRVFLPHHAVFKTENQKTKIRVVFNASSKTSTGVSLNDTQTHLETLHGGLQLTLSTLRQRFWVVNARNLVKSCVHKCITCVRERAKLGSQLMGSLPAARVSRSFTFEHTGVDYAGPFSVKLHHGRNAKAIKCYVAVFVCLSTRAVHLELVSRLDTEAFLAALTRFISRRGKPVVMYSDNGLNFQGADAELKRAYRCSLEAARAQNTDSISKIEWKFIPVATPHWGGLWESAVKSMKHHLKRSLGVFVPNFEEMATLLTKIEACLNSRPISRLHDDPESLDVLTPGHFLSGRALNSPPELSTLDLRESSLNRWQTVNRITETFWKKWSSEYLHTLQHRPKWQNSNSEFGEGDLVLVKVPNNPPRMWTLGRILKLVPGVDGVARVAVLKTARKEIQRSLSQLCKLPS